MNCAYRYDPRNRKEKSLRHTAMVAKILDDNKPIKSLKSLLALFQTSRILVNFISFGKSWRNFGPVYIGGGPLVGEVTRFGGVTRLTI